MQQFYDFRIEKIEGLSSEEKTVRKKNLELFYLDGFPSKKDEDWKFTDLNFILSKNFTKIANTDLITEERPCKSINEFEHNFISLMNGKLISKSFDHEEKDKIFISNFNYKKEIILHSKNTLNFLNNALAKDGFSLEISKNYKLKAFSYLQSFF